MVGIIQIRDLFTLINDLPLINNLLNFVGKKNLLNRINYNFKLLLPDVM